MQKHEIPAEYRKDIDKAVKILKAEGCTEIYLFGSLVEGGYSENSDIDFAVKGCPKGKYYKILGKLLLELDHPVDLIDLDRNDDFVEYIKKEGVFIHVQ